MAVAAILAVFAAMLTNLLVTNPRWQWDVVWQYIFSPPILAGVSKTIQLTVIAMAIGLVIGVIAAVARLSPNPITAKIATLYVWFFRGTPLLVQLLFWFYLSALLPEISLGIPFGPSFVTLDTNVVITPFIAAIVGLGVNEGAYMSEIVRAGLLSIPRGQTEAAQAIGMTRGQVMRRIILPQAMRIIVPPTGNQLIGMLKHSSLVLVIGYSELLTSATLIYARTFETIPLLVVAALWYLVITALLSTGQYFVERHYGRGYRQQQVANPGWTRTLLTSRLQRVGTR
jgi:polar amino acid transport system permease protein